jgi:lysophospholipase L1-like esterase
MKNKKKILFLGASITQGRVSKNYVDILQQRLGKKQYKFINHGIAGYESYNVLKKLDKAIHAKPDFVIVLVGTNDVLSSLDTKLADLSRKLKHIPHEPTLFHFSNNIKTIINRLNHETNSKIAISSLPVIGENLNSIENKTVAEYNAGLKRITENENAIYLPVYEKQKDFLIHKIAGKGKDYTRNIKTAFKTLFLHYLLFMSLDTISKKNGYLLLTDGIHQNSLGAGFIANEIEDFIRANENKIKDK